MSTRSKITFGLGHQQHTNFDALCKTMIGAHHLFHRVSTISLIFIFYKKNFGRKDFDNEDSQLKSIILRMDLCNLHSQNGLL